MKKMLQPKVVEASLKFTFSIKMTCLQSVRKITFCKCYEIYKMVFRHLPSIPFANLFPVNDFPEIFYIGWSAVLLVEVIGMLPYVASQQRR